MGESKLKRVKGEETLMNCTGVQTVAGRVQIRWESKSAATPMGQLAYFIEFLTLTGLWSRWLESCPLSYNSPNAPSKADVLGTWTLSVLAGHKRYSHVTAIRCDGVNPELMGMNKVISEDAMRGALKRIPEAEGTAWLDQHLSESIPPTPEQYEIAQLLKRRAKLTSLRAALGMSLKGVNGFGADLKVLKKRFDQVIARIDQRVKVLVETSPDRKQHVAHLRTIYGVGSVVSAALVNVLERVPLKNADAFVAFTGLDPRPDDSGQHRGKRRLSKRGPSELRRLLFLAALSAAKTKAWHPIYEHYREKGLSSTAVLVILARRIARTAWSIYTHKTEFDSKRLISALT